MTMPQDASIATARELEPEAVLAGAGKQIAGRSLSQIAWRRLRRDKLAMTGGVVVILLILVAATAPLLISWFGQPPNELHQDLIDPAFRTVKGGWGGISSKHLLGVDDPLGRDLFSRILAGAQISLLIAFLATLISVVIGVILGLVAGYLGGWIDTLISRLMDIFLAFPLLLFAIAITGIVSSHFKIWFVNLTGNTLHESVLIFVIGFFNWPYIGRIVRGQALSLREREFVDAARSLGARTPRILFRELLPNLVAPILVYATLLIPTNILFEAGLDYLGVGVHPPQASWGQMLSDATNVYVLDPEYLMVPGIAIFVTVLAFNLLGDGLRDAFDPRAR